MTYSDKVRELGEFLRQRSALEQEMQELEELEALSEGRAAQLTGMPGGGPRADGLAMMVERLERCRGRVRNRQEQAALAQGQVLDNIELVEDAWARRLLKSIYIDGMTQTDAAEKMQLSRSVIGRAHRRAVEQMMKKKKRKSA